MANSSHDLLFLHQNAMKIINSTTRNSDLNGTTIPELDYTSSLNDDSLIHIVQKGSDDKFTSRKMKIEVFKKKIYEAVNNTFRTEYWDTHISNIGENHSTSGMFKSILEKLGDSKPVDILETDDFVKHLNYDFNVIVKYIDLQDSKLDEKINELKKISDDLNCHFASEMDLSETSSSHDRTVDNDYCQMSIQDGQRISNEWTVPETGNLVVYGWLDSNDALNNKAIQNAFCVLEAKINSTMLKENWEIIGVQPVIPSKNITYVGFNVPVKKNLTIRIRTGFTVGVKSGNYSNEQDGSGTLANSTANGFKCQVFSLYSEKEDDK